MDKPVGIRVKSRGWSAVSGFTIIEVLTAFFVMGVATTIFIAMYTASLSVSRSSTHYAVASQIAEEYMAELRVNPQQFVWPNFDDAGIGELILIGLADEDGALRVVAQPTAMPITPAAHKRETNLYREYTWKAEARIQELDSNFVEVLVTIGWQHLNKPQFLYLTSTVPRSVGEGIGQ